jgi:predicted amidohydrolase
MDDNLERSLDAISQAASGGADLICFPELQLSPFFPQYQALDVSHYAIEIDSPIIKRIKDRCRDSNIVGFPNVYLHEGDNRYDASPVINSDGQLLGVSKMVHIVQTPGFFEQDYYSPSDTGFQVFDTSVGKIGVVVCFDRHYPESIRSCVLQGAELIIIPTANTKAEPLEMFEWELRIPAMQNGVYIAMCNRVGLEGEMDFCGESIVVDPNGNVVKKADDTEQILYADIDFELVREARKSRPFLDLRRPDSYEK